VKVVMPDTHIPKPTKFHLDRRADRLIEYGAAAGAPDDLLTTEQVADWLSCSKQWLEIARYRGYSPPYLKFGQRVRYRRSDLVEWLEARMHQCTSEYNGTARVGFVRRAPIK
jgi:hypothetical protein